MDIRQLATFRTAAHTLSFTRTAEALDYVQSSVTAQIQGLEEELGVKLFDRLGRRLALTDAGERLLVYAERILSLEAEARAAVVGGVEPAGVVTMSAPETLCAYRLPAVLRRFRERFPEVTLRLKPTMLEDVRRQLVEGGVDVAFVLEELTSQSGLISEALLPEPLVLLSAPDHALARAERVRPGDLEGQQFLLTETGCGYRAVFDRFMTAAGARATSTLEFDSVEAIKQCVMAGMGMTVLPAVTVAAEVADGRLAVVRWTTDPGFQVMTRMVVHKDKWMSPALRAFLDVTRETFREMGGEGLERSVA